MANLSPNLQHLTGELPANRRAEVEQAIVSSPYLRQIMTEAVNTGTLEHIRMGVPGANEGGHYDDQKNAIYLSPETFTIFKQPSDRLDAITSTLGHETGHALYAEKASKELNYTTYSITNGIRTAGPGGEFDATGLVGAFIHDARRNEAQAEMHGWDALASRIEHLEGKPPSRNDMLKRADASTDCVEPLKKGDGYRLASGIVLDADMRMSETRLPKAGPINLEPVAQCHFDSPRASLGAGGAANYTNYYGAYLVQQLADDTRHWVDPPTIKLDMEKLGLDKAQLESTGLRLGNDGFSLVDSSQGRYKPMTLRSSGSGIHGTPDTVLAETALAQQPSLMAEVSVQTPSAPRLRGPGTGTGKEADDQEPPAQRHEQTQAFPTDHKDFALFAAIRQRLPEGTSEEKAAEVMLDAKVNGIRTVDHLRDVVVERGHVWVAGKTIGDMSKVDLNSPAPPLQESLQKSETFDQQREQQLSQWREQDLQLNQNAQNAPSIGARTMN